MAFYDVPVIRTYEEAKKYFQTTTPFSKGRFKGKTPLGNRSRGWLHIDEGKDYYRISWFYKPEDNHITYYKDTPTQAHLTIHGWDVTVNNIISRVLGTRVLQHQFELWWMKSYRATNVSIDGPNQIYLGKGTHIFEDGVPQVKNNTMTKTYLNRKKFNAIYKKCKSFVDYLTITNKIRDEGFSYEEVEDTYALQIGKHGTDVGGVRTVNVLALAESTNMDDHYTLARFLARHTDNAVKTDWRWQTQALTNDALTKPMLKTFRHYLKCQFARDIFTQEEVTVSGWSSDSNAKYAHYLTK
jgi:hypothetical protein